MGLITKVADVAALGLLLLAIGCKSSWVDATVVNETGAPVRELEVDYPSASFGANALATGASMHYRFQIRGDGPIKVEYTGDSGKIFHGEGLTLTDHQQGSLLIRLMPAGKVDFVPNLNPAA